MLMTQNPISKLMFVVPLTLMVAVTGCSRNKNNLPDNSNQLGLNGQNGQNGTAAPGTSQDFTLNVGDRILFTTDSSSLTPQARTTLTKQAAWLNQYRNHAIVVEGHADERGTREYNLALGGRRAAAARDYLISQGVARSRLRVISFGKERPVEACNDTSCQSKNRRAQTVLGAGNS